MRSEPVNLVRGQRDVAEELIPVYRPDLSGNERAYVLECLDTSWISSIGAFVQRFETSVAQLTGARHAIAVSNGTVALHLALHCLGIGPGDEVIVPSFTYIASVNTIAQTGARPVFADSLPSDWLLDPAGLEQLITPRTRAIVPVHLYGAACDMPALKALADRHGLAIVEDCAEALGTTIAGQHVGRWSRAATFSFFGNKTITTGEGGMVTTDDDDLAQLLRQVKGQGQSLTRRYWHEMLGFNYRMTNIAAAIGTAQMERLPATLARKQALIKEYNNRLSALPVTLQVPRPEVESSGWLVSLLLPENVDRDRIMQHMADKRVETRPVFYCAHQMPMYARQETFKIAENISARGISLPSYPALSDNDLDRVAGALRSALDEQSV